MQPQTPVLMQQTTSKLRNTQIQVLLQLSNEATKWYVLNKHRIYAGRFLLLSAFQQLSDSKINFPVVSYLLRGSKELQGLVLIYSLRSKIVVVLTLVFYISTFVYI
jgi:hypothetical protein